MHDLQNSYAHNVEVEDAAALDDLQRIIAKVEQFKEFLQGHSNTQSSKADTLREELNENVSGLGNIRSTFEKFKAASDERYNVFANFEGGNAGGIDIQDNFRSALLTHLSQQIVVKEHRDRY